MTAARLILLLLLILVAVVSSSSVLRRAPAQRDAQRVEAAGCAPTPTPWPTTVRGQSVFADQAAQRAEAGAGRGGGQGPRGSALEAEAAEHRAAAEATQREYEATMRRADDIDPDVKKSSSRSCHDGEPTRSRPRPHLPGRRMPPPGTRFRRSEAAASLGRWTAPNADDVSSRSDSAEGTALGAAEARVGRGDEAARGAAVRPRPARLGLRRGVTAASGGCGGAAAGLRPGPPRDDESDPESERIASPPTSATTCPPDGEREGVDEGPARAGARRGLRADDAGTEGT
jgi:hypothetical protein